MYVGNNVLKLQEDHYGARLYDPQHGLGRLSGCALQAHCWHAVDPADELFSPYVYCTNNPVILVDSDRRVFVFINGQHNPKKDTPFNTIRKFWLTHTSTKCE